jgi:hypothetical protein
LRKKKREELLSTYKLPSHQVKSGRRSWSKVTLIQSTLNRNVSLDLAAKASKREERKQAVI